MAIDDYLTPTNVSIWVGDAKVDDAYRVDWEARSAKTPLYGWADKQYRSVAEGREIITGRLIITYRFPGYLFTALSNIGVTRHKPDDRTVSDLRNTLIDLRGGTTEKRVETLMRTAQQGTLQDFNKHKLLMEAMLSSNTAQDKSMYKLSADKGFDISVRYGPVDAYHLEKVLRDVHIVGESQTVSASATGGGDISSSGSPIFEIYSFLCREIKELVHDRRV